MFEIKNTETIEKYHIKISLPEDVLSDARNA